MYYIVTNNHVVAMQAQFQFRFTGKETLEASLVGTDSTADIAVVKVLKSAFKDAGVEYKVADFGDSDKLKVGESVIAIGNALGEGKSATGGMVSVLNKTIEVNNQALNVIQTSAAINPGNSGGALVNYDGSDNRYQHSKNKYICCRRHGICNTKQHSQGNYE